MKKKVRRFCFAATVVLECIDEVRLVTALEPGVQLRVGPPGGVRRRSVRIVHDHPSVVHPLNCLSTVAAHASEDAPARLAAQATAGAGAAK